MKALSRGVVRALRRALGDLITPAAIESAYLWLWFAAIIKKVTECSVGLTCTARVAVYVINQWLQDILHS